MQYRAARSSRNITVDREAAWPRRMWLNALYMWAVAALAGMAWAATITVNTTADELDSLVANDKCSLREAIISTNENRDVGGCHLTRTGTYGSDTIILPANTYKLTRTSGLFDQDFGDLDIRDNLTISGAGSSSTVIDGNNIDRVIEVDDVALSLKNLTIRNGTESTREGGGIYSIGNITLDSVVVRDNMAPYCGGIYISNTRRRDGQVQQTSGKLTVNRSTISGNRGNHPDYPIFAGYGGGICNKAVLIMTNSTVSGNFAPQRGGGIQNLDNATMTLSNSTVSGNTAGNGGGIHSSGGTIKLLNTTVTNNNGVNVGGLVREGGIFRLQNSVVAGNSSADPPTHPDCRGAFESSGNNLIGNNNGCTGFGILGDQAGSQTIPLDARLGPLAANGGPTLTHALLPSSPAIDAANSADCPTSDQRGESRPKDGNGDGFALCDIGAYEVPTVSPTADLSLSITNSPSQPEIGSVFSYSLTVTNHGPAVARDTILSLELASALSFVSAPGCTHTSGTVRCNSGLVRVGDARTVTVVVRAPQVESAVRSTGRVTSSTSDPTVSNNTRVRTTLIVEPAADLALVISDTPNPVRTNQPLTYTLVISNAGPNAASGIMLNATLPVASVFLNHSGECTQVDLEVTCGLGTLSSGAARTVQIQILPTTPGTLSFSAIVSSSVPDPTASNNSRTITTSVNESKADLSVIKHGPSHVQVAAAFAYALAVSNAGPHTAQGVTLRDRLPSGVVFVSSSSTLVGTQCEATTTSEGSTVTCSMGDILAGAFGAVTLNVNAPTTSREVTSTATIASSTTDPNDSNNSSSVTTLFTAEPSPAGADVSLIKFAPVSVQVGSRFDYTLTVTNNGPNAATGVTLTNLLPDNLEFIAASNGCVHANRTVICTIGSVASGANRTTTITVRAPPSAGELTNTASISSNNDLNPNNNTASVSTQVTESAAEADLILFKAGPARVPAGSEFNYTLTVVNAGPVTTGDVVIVDTLPEALTFITASDACTQQGNLVECRLGVLAANATVSINLTVAAPTSLGRVTNVATVTGGAAEMNLENNESSATTIIESDPEDEKVSLSASLGPNTPVNREVQQGASDVAVLQVNLLASGSEDVLLKAATVQVASNSSDLLHVRAVRLLLDSDGDGHVSNTDSALASGEFSATSNTITLGLATPLEIAEGSSNQLLIAVDLHSNLAGQTVLALLALGGLLGTVRVARGRWRLVFSFLLASILFISCNTSARNPPSLITRSYQFALIEVVAEGKISSTFAEAGGLPLQGASITVKP